MLQRFLRRDQDDPYLALHTETSQGSLYDDDPAPRSLLQQPRVRLIGGGALALTAIAILFGGGGKDGASIPIISAPTPTTRIKPVDPQGLELPHKNMQVYSYVDPNSAPQPKVERMIPAPQETPMLPPRRAAAAPVHPSAVVTPSAPVASPAPVGIMPPAPPATTRSGSLQPVAAQPVPASTGTVPQPAQAPRAFQQQAVAAPAPKPQSAPPAQPQRVATLPTAAPATPPAAAKPAAALPAPAVATTPATTPTPAAAQPASTGTFRLQLGSLRDMAAAQQHWKTAQSRSGGALNGLQPQILRVDIPGKGTYFRVQAGSWPTRQDAQQACDKLKLARVDCMIVR